MKTIFVVVETTFYQNQMEIETIQNAWGTEEQALEFIKEMESIQEDMPSDFEYFQYRIEKINLY